MAGSFMQASAQGGALSAESRRLLHAIGVRSPGDLYSVVSSFPSLARAGLDIPFLSNVAYQALGESYANFAPQAAAGHPKVALGALPPPQALFTIGARVGLPPAGEPMDLTFSPPGGEPDVDVRPPDWPVRDQNPRGTCVAFGAAACVEGASGGAAPTNHSEQFLYWAIKTTTGDPYPDEDGTWLEFARDALAGEGICLESEWGYVNAEVDPVSGATATVPTEQARASASGRRTHARFYERSPANAAQTALDALRSEGQPMAVSLPVFRDPLTPDGPTNWTTPVGWLYGTVLNPPPTSVVDGGHCVCITGFVRDSAEPWGGYFIIRNSWGTDWGSDNPDPAGGPAPEPGYGTISATYVDKYCWELFQL